MLPLLLLALPLRAAALHLHCCNHCSLYHSLLQQLSLPSLLLLMLQTRSVRDLARLSLNRETVEYVSVADVRQDDAATATSTTTSTDGPGSTPSKYVPEYLLTQILQCGCMCMQCW
jgi:hypothetical protein